MPECTRCGETNPAEFHVGKRTICKSCVSTQIKERKKTIPGLTRKIYFNQLATSKKAGRPPPAYTYEQLHDWITTNPNFPALHSAWVASGRQMDLIPSVDRLDNTQSYDLNNIQLVTWKQNHTNQGIQHRSGQYLHKASKGVRQLDLDGNFIMEHPSVACALRHVKGTHSQTNGKRQSISNITNVCNGIWPTAYKYKWEWVYSLS